MTANEFFMLDRPDVLGHLFHPRPSPHGRQRAEGREDLLIPVSDSIRIGASLHLKDKDAPLLLFFHGNGEIVPDYDDLGRAFTQGAGVNFLVADYRGYGDSGGSPTVSAMLADAEVIYDFVLRMKEERGMEGPLSVMGRSLGSAPALELAASQGKGIHSLIVESGFAFAGPLLRVLGLDPDAMGVAEENGMGNLGKMKQVACPCLIIHAEQDVLIPFTDGQALYDACPADAKKLLTVKGAGHNDIFIHGMAPYLEQVKAFCS